MPGDRQRQPKPRSPSGGSEDEVFLDVLLTAAVFTRALNDVLKSHDLTQPQYNVLRILRGAGAEGLPCGDIASRMLNHDPDVTRLLDRLEARGFVTRDRDEADRRVVVGRLSDEGRRIVDALDTPVSAMQARLLGHLAPGSLQTLSDLLATVRSEPA